MFIWESDFEHETDGHLLRRSTQYRPSEIKEFFGARN